MILIGNGRLITHNQHLPYLEDGCVAVEGERILAFGPTAELRQKYPQAEWADARGRVIMPGLINAHTHIYSSFARGMALTQPRPNKDFMEILQNLWWRVDKALNLEDIKYSAYATLLESVRCGVTTVFDHHASPHHIEDSLFTIAAAAKDIGVRASLCYEVSDRDGLDIARAGLRENAGFIRHAQQNGGDMLKGMMGLHASFTLSDETLATAAAMAEGREAGYHIHVAEGIADLYDSLRRCGKRVVERLLDAGILGEKTLAVHSVHINGREMEILRQCDSMVVHNSESNMGNAVGCSAVLQMLNQGLTVGMGTDAYTQDMLESLKVANIIHKHQLCNPSVGFGESLGMLFSGNRAIAARFFSRPLGIIEEGACADIIVVDYTPHTPLGADNTGGHIMFGMMGRAVDSVMINGRWVMSERQMTALDEQAILAQSRAQAADFWQRV